MMRTIELVTRFCLLALCAGFVALLVYCVAHRIFYPFELEFLEGDMLLTALRILEHKPLYTPPGTDYMPGIYPPFYYMVVAAAFWLFEPGLPVLRGISVLSLLVIFILLYSIVCRETQRRWLALVSIGLFASFYHYHACWYDVGRLDSFFFCLLLLSLWLATQTQRFTLAAVGSSFVLCLAFLTKQSVLIYSPFVVLFLFLKNRRLSIVFAVIFTLLCSIVFLALQTSSDGWFAIYTILNPLTFPKVRSTFNIFEWVIKTFPIFLVLMAVFAIAVIIRVRQWKDISLWEITLIPSIIAYVRIAPIEGAFANDSIYLTLWLSLVLPLWIQKFVLAIQPSYRYMVAAMMWALLSVQLIDLRYAPDNCLPTPGSASKGAEFIARLRNAPGPVLVHHHPVYAWMAGKMPSMTAANLWAYNSGKRHYTPLGLFDQIRNGYFSLIILDDISAYFTDFVALVKDQYVLERTIAYQNAREFCPPVPLGHIVRPLTIWKPK